MDVKRLVGLAMAAVLGAGSLRAQPLQGEVNLPLGDYLALVEAVERTERLRVEALAQEVEPVNEVVSQRLTAVVGTQEAELSAEFEVLLQGKTLVPVPLPVAGLAETVEILDGAGRPRSTAVVSIDRDGRTVLSATEAGRYTVRLRSRTRFGNGTGTGRLSLGRVAAAVAATEVELPVEMAWASPGAVVVDDRVEGNRRMVRLATPRGSDVVLEVYRKVDSAEADKLLAQSVVLTLVQLRPEGLRRHDVVLYEVRRGGLDRFGVRLPADLEIEQVSTDEGTVVPVVESGQVTVHRGRQLRGSGFLVLSSTLPAVPSRGLSLESVVPEFDVRAHYLALASSVSADIAPVPETGWTRVDVSDLPPLFSEALSALDLSAAWRRSSDGDGDAGRLGIALLPRAPIAPSTIRRRDTTTLLTVDGTVLHLDRFIVESEGRSGAALDVTLPPGGTLWSTKVDGQPVRPFDRGGVIAVPLGFSGGNRAEVEVVSVLEKVLPPGRSLLSFELPQVSAPVLVHRLRLLLPQVATYRLRRGDLRLASIRSGAPVGVAARDPWTLLSRSPQVLTDRINVGGNESGQVAGIGGLGGLKGGSAHLRVTVRDDQGGSLPGVTLLLARGDASAVLLSDATGVADVRGLADGSYSLTASLEGLSTVEYPSVTLVGGRTAEIEITLTSAVTESITVTSETALRDQRREGSRSGRFDFGDVPTARDAADLFQVEIQGLQQGLVGGVKPLPIAIPETGKAFAFSGVLPPQRIALELEVKRER